MDKSDTPFKVALERISKKRRLPTQLQAEILNQEHLNETLEGLKSLRYQAYSGKKPWLDEEGNVIWSPMRIRVAKIVFSQAFETIMGLIIVGNIVLIMIEADQDASCYPTYTDDYDACPYRSDANQTLSIVNTSLLLIYTAECGIRFFVEHMQFFCNRWNMIDLVTVMLGWASVLLAGVINLSLLRLTRLIRVLRAIRVLISVPEFYLLVTGLYSSIKAIIFGSMMLLLFLIFWAVIAVELFHPHVSNLTFSNCPRCRSGFGNVFAASLTLFQQIVAGDAWGQISIPLVETAPQLWPVLFAIMITISLGIMNLILAVIVERASEARENDHEQKIRKKDDERAKNMVELAVLCANLDKDQSGTVSLDEMRRGYDNVAEFKRLMDHMDIKRDEMELIFRVLDEDKDGNLSYLEFCKNLGSFFKRDPVIMHSLVQCSVMELKKLVQEEVVSVVKRQHEELMVGLGLSPGKPAAAAPSASPSGMEPQALIRSAESLETLKHIERELKPLLAQAETIAAVLDTDLSVGATTVVVHQSQAEEPMSKSVSDPVPPDRHPDALERHRADSGMDAEFEHLHESFRRQAEKAELLQSRLRKALQCLSSTADGEVDQFHSKLFVV